MTKRTVVPVLLVLGTLLAAQQSDIRIWIKGGDRPKIAVPDFRGSGEAQPLMNVFNQTLFSELQGSGIFTMAPKSFYPLRTPQQPQDFVSGGMRMEEWSRPPVEASYLAFGYTAAQDKQLVLFGWLYNVRQPDASSAQVLGKRYFGALDDNGARKVAREFAADILALAGVSSLIGSKIYFVSNRTGEKQIWSMDYDGSNQKLFAPYPKQLCTMPSVSRDGTRLAFTRFGPRGQEITVHSLETGRRLPFVNPAASMNATADFTPDGKQLVFSSTLSGYAQIYVAGLEGGGLRRLTSSRTVEMEPKVNPKTGAELVFISGRGGLPQLYRMNMDGADVQRLTTGEGEASNPSWHPDGQHIAFAWTRGHEPGNWNIFVMDVATRDYVQLTFGLGRNENPSWAPDGRHLVFSTNRSGGTQIWTMLADGSQARPLTTQGRNEMPVWSKH